MSTIVWFENDLRLTDNPALHRAAVDGNVIPVFIWAPEEHGAWAPGGAHRWWLHHSLYSLAADLESAGSRLVVRKGPSEDVLLSLAQETGASCITWNDRYEPALRDRDGVIEKRLAAEGINTVRYQSVTLHDPDQVRTGKDGPYRVFTPFWKKFLSVVDVPSGLPRPTLRERSPSKWPDSVSIDELSLLPRPDWAQGLRDTWLPGETGALDVLQSFADESITDYDRRRNLPSHDGTSMLSPHLRHGEISPRQVWNHIMANVPDSDGKESFLREIGWREFSYHLLNHYPSTPQEPLNERFSNFPWIDDDRVLKLWQRGMTGYPIVDAGMRQLWHIGWMHNRVRMVVASFLTKDLLIHWQEGARWFLDTLVDGDLANNTMGWQWAAGSGADAQPFFRIFNPVSQGKRFDPEGAYVRKWIPELDRLPDKYIHCPWEAPADVLTDASVELGSDYPLPLVDHAEARRQALTAFQTIS